MMIKPILTLNDSDVNNFIKNQLAPIMMHQKQYESLSNSVIGLLFSNSLQPAAIGRGLAEAKGNHSKHCIKQVDRMLRNENIRTKTCESTLALLLIGQRSRIAVAMDWTVFAKDKQMTLTLRLITKHGRATPLLWKTVSIEGLKGKKTNYVFELLEKLRCLTPKECQVIVLADREFGTLKNMEKLKRQLGFDYILRIKRNFTVKDKTGHTQLAHEWLTQGKALCIDDAEITVKNYSVEKVVICKDKNMKDMWVLACSMKDIATQTILNYYAKRWSTETSYRDEKDLQFGLGLKKARISQIEKRDRLLLVSALAIIILTLLGAASEQVGYDKYIKANTSKMRTHSLFNQGRILITMLKNMKPIWREKIMGAFIEIQLQLRSIKNEQFVV